MTWICANCGAEHDSDEMPCRKCACERFVRPGERAEDDTVETPTVSFVCENCGRTHPRHNPPCNDCGAMGFRTVRGEDDLPDPEDGSDTWSPPGAVSRRELLLGGGAAVGGIAAIWASNRFGVTPGDLLSPGRSPTSVAKAFLRAFVDMDARKLETLAHSDGPILHEQVLNAGIIPVSENPEVTVDGAEEVRRDGSVAVVRVEFTVEDVEAGPARGDVVYELRKEDGDWRVWSVVDPPG